MPDGLERGQGGLRGSRATRVCAEDHARTVGRDTEVSCELAGRRWIGCRRTGGGDRDDGAIRPRFAKVGALLDLDRSDERAREVQEQDLADRRIHEGDVQPVRRRAEILDAGEIAHVVFSVCTTALPITVR